MPTGHTREADGSNFLPGFEARAWQNFGFADGQHQGASHYITLVIPLRRHRSLVFHVGRNLPLDLAI